jgi:hypothetical protein
VTESPKPKQLWIGLVELRPLHPDNEHLDSAKGAFTNIVTWAANLDQYRQNVEYIAGTLGLFVAEIEDAEPVEARREKATLGEELEEIVLRAEGNPNAIIYGTFYTFNADTA